MKNNQSTNILEESEQGIPPESDFFVQEQVPCFCKYELNGIIIGVII